LFMGYGRVIHGGAPESLVRQPADCYPHPLLADYNLLAEALASALLPGYDMHAGKHWMLRPEQLGLVDPGTTPLNAAVQEVYFCGSHYTVLAVCMGQPLRIRTMQAVRKEEIFGLTLVQGVPCLIQ